MVKKNIDFVAKCTCLKKLEHPKISLKGRNEATCICALYHSKPILLRFETESMSNRQWCCCWFSINTAVEPRLVFNMRASTKVLSLFLLVKLACVKSACCPNSHFCLVESLCLWVESRIAVEITSMLLKFTCLYNLHVSDIFKHC